MSSKILNDNGIAIVDFAAFLDGSDKQAVADKMLASFKDIGFVYLLNHGIPPECIARMFSLHLSQHHTLGYSSPGQEKVIQHVAEAPDVKESFECGREGDEVMPNIWLPQGLCYKIELNIMRALALGLQLPEEYFDKYHTTARNQLRLLRYRRCARFPTEALETEKNARIGQHSDFGSITLLLQDNVGGLEVEDPHVAGTFLPPVPGSLMVNARDSMMRWSNDTIRSTIHRVRAPGVDYNTVVDCIPGTWDEERPKKYEPISAQGND
ncbi:thymine dioxygenase [Mycena galericulata]|nr:thymine dioxygenase [Mycena galericulata]